MRFDSYSLHLKPKLTGLNSFDAWIRSVDGYHGNDLLYLSPKGNIPEAAVIKRGEKRAQPFREKKRFDVTTFPDGTDVGKLMEEEEDKDSYEISAYFLFNFIYLSDFCFGYSLYTT